MSKPQTEINVRKILQIAEDFRAREQLIKKKTDRKVARMKKRIGYRREGEEAYLNELQNMKIVNSKRNNEIRKEMGIMQKDFMKCYAFTTKQHVRVEEELYKLERHLYQDYPQLAQELRTNKLRRGQSRPEQVKAQQRKAKEIRDLVAELNIAQKKIQAKRAELESYEAQSEHRATLDSQMANLRVR